MVFTKIKLSQRDMLLSKFKEISAGTHCKFPYGRTTLHVYLVKAGLHYQKADNLKVIMKSQRPFAWKYKYLMKVQKYREDGYSIVYLDDLVFHMILFLCFGLMVQKVVCIRTTTERKTSSNMSCLEQQWLCRKLSFNLWKETFNALWGLPR